MKCYSDIIIKKIQEYRKLVMERKLKREFPMPFDYILDFLSTHMDFKIDENTVELLEHKKKALLYQIEMIDKIIERQKISNQAILEGYGNVQENIHDKNEKEAETKTQ